MEVAGDFRFVCSLSWDAAGYPRLLWNVKVLYNDMGVSQSLHEASRLLVMSPRSLWFARVKKYQRILARRTHKPVPEGQEPCLRNLNRPEDFIRELIPACFRYAMALLFRSTVLSGCNSKAFTAVTTVEKALTATTAVTMLIAVPTNDGNVEVPSSFEAKPAVAVAVCAARFPQNRCLAVHCRGLANAKF